MDKHFSVQAALRRSRTIGVVREFFRARDVLEVETPVLAHAGSTDCHIDLFECRYHTDGHSDTSTSVPAYLQTSPEYHMKRLLAGGFPDIYQICKVFRNGERGIRHNPEFTILEWYRRDYDMHKLMDEITALCREILGEVPILKRSYRDVFREYTGIDPLVAGIDELSDWCSIRGLHHQPFTTITDALQFIMAQSIEPALPYATLFFVYNYPAEQAVLAVLDEKEKQVARRFELYFNGVELANGFQELSDAQENLIRLRQDNQRRREMGKKEVPLDMRFIDALRSGLPACSGVALGIDRLVMLAEQYSTIDEVISFTWENS